MGKKRELSAFSDEEVKASSACALASGGHDYTQGADDMEAYCIAEDDFPPLPATPNKPPALKKKTHDPVNSSLVSDIHCQLIRSLRSLSTTDLTPLRAKSPT